MKIIVVPIEHLIVENIEKIGEYIWVPIQFLDEELGCEITEGMEEREVVIVNYLLNNQREFLDKFLGLEYCTIAVREQHEEKDINVICHEIEQTLDYLRITQYRFDRKEWSMGVPGSLCDMRLGFIVDYDKENVKPIVNKKHHFCEIPGIGLEVGFSPIFRHDDSYNAIFSQRHDEVYLSCRYYISKACKAFSIVSLDSTFAELFATLEGIGMLDCEEGDFRNFTKENKRIMSILCCSQEEYEKRLDQYCYYSEVIRTLVLHQGHHLLEYMDRKSTFRMLTDIFFTIIKYAIRLIDTKIEEIGLLHQYVEKEIEKFDNHSSSMKNSFTLINKELSFEGNRDIFVFPIGNFVSREIIQLNNIIIIPKEYKIESTDTDSFYIDEILSDERVRELNGEVALVFYIGKYRLESIDVSLTAWQYLDDICGAIQEQLVPLFISQKMSLQRDMLFDSVGIYKGFRMGYLYDTYYKELFSLNGRVYSLYNSTVKPYDYAEAKIDNWLVNDVFMKDRNDVIAYDCKRAVQILGKAVYEDDATHMLTDMFEAVEQLYPQEYNINKKWKWIAGLIMEKRSKYDQIYKRLCDIGERYRTPIFHYGKSAQELMNENDIEELFEELKLVIFNYIKKVMSMSVFTYEDLKDKRLEHMNIMS